MASGFALSEIDTTTPHPARMYGALLGGYFLCPHINRMGLVSSGPATWCYKTKRP